MKWIALIAALAMFPGCFGKSAPTTNDTPEPATVPPPPDGEGPLDREDQDPLVVGEEGGVKDAVGQVAVFEGKAVNAKLGAAVDSDQGVVYCLGMDAWPDDVVGEDVSVKGRLERTDQFKAEVAEDGAISQGTAGGDLVLHDVSYDVVGEEPGEEPPAEAKPAK